MKRDLESFRAKIDLIQEKIRAIKFRYLTQHNNLNSTLAVILKWLPMRSKRLQCLDAESAGICLPYAVIREFQLRVASQYFRL